MSAFLRASLVLGLCAGPAWAHLPHDQVTAVAAPPDLSASQPWFMVVDPVVSDVLLRSDDGGWNWEIVGGDPTVDRITGAGTMVDGTIVLMGEIGLWWSGDLGDSWEYEPLDLPPTSIVVEGDTLFVGSRDGLWSGRPELLDQVELDGASIKSLHQDAGVVLAISQDGRVLRRDGPGDWTALGVAGSGATGAAWEPEQGVVYAADADGGVFAWQLGSWAACGALPELPDPFIYQLATVDGRLFVAPGSHAPYVSDDDCASWRDIHALTAETRGTGSVEDPADAFTSLEGVGDQMFVAGWGGFARSDDGGETWSEAFLLPVDYTRGLSFAPDFEQSGRVYIGSYAAGPFAALRGGDAYRNVGADLIRFNSQHVYVAPDETDAVYAIVGHSPWRSTDGGDSWTQISSAFSPILNLAVREEGEVWMVGNAYAVDGVGVARSQDRGRNWLFFPSTVEPLAGSIPGKILVVDDLDGLQRVFVFGTQDVRVIRSDDDGVSWSVVYETSVPNTEVTRGQPWPPDAPEAVVLGVGSDILRTDDWGDTWQTVAALAPDTVLVLAGADDGSLVAGLQSGRMVRSTDGGHTWQDLGIQLNNAPRSLTLRPGFATDPVALVGTQDGIFAVEDVLSEVATARRWGSWQIVDATGESLICDPCPTGERVVEPYTGASHSMVVRLLPETTFTIALRGEVIRVTGAIEGTGTGVIEVGSPNLPGESITIGGEPTDGVVELARFELDEGWHTVEIRGISGSGILIDSVEGITDREPLAYSGEIGDSGSTADGGAGDGGAGDGGAGDGGAGDGGASHGDAGAARPEKPQHAEGCGGCASAAPAGGGWLVLVAALGWRRRR